MVTELKQENSYQEAFRALQESQPESSVSWLARLRESAMDSFQELGFPSTRNEEWKYTNIAPIAKAAFQPQKPGVAAASEFRANELAGLSVAEAEKSQLVFVNGVLRDDLSSLTALPQEVVAIDLVGQRLIGLRLGTA